jgi:hypothetical protein
MYGLAKAQRTIKILNMKKVVLSILSFCTMCFLNSCYYDNFKELNPDVSLANTSNCDTATSVSYANQIVPILNSACLGCHNGGAGHDMTSHSGVRADALSGKLYGSVVQNGTALDMPQGGSKLSDCDIAKIKKWADAGAPNN